MDAGNTIVYSYVTSSVLFLLSALLVGRLYLNKLYPKSLVIACMATSVWSFLLAFYSPQLLLGNTLILVEMCRYALWILGLLFTVHFLTGIALTRKAKLTVLGLLVSFFIINVIFFSDTSTGTQEGLKQQLIWCGLLLAIAGIVCVEQVFRNAPETMKRSIQYFCVALAAMFFYDLYLYSNALMFRAFDSEVWAVRGLVNTAAAILILIGATRPQWLTSVRVSQAMAFYTTSLVASGLFLLVMATGGYYVRVYGGEWGKLAQVSILALSAIFIAIFFTSAKKRAALRVLVSKHFFKHQYDYRQEWLKLIGALSQPATSSSFNNHALETVANLFHSPAACLWLKERNNFIPVCTYNMTVADDAVEPDDSPFILKLKEEWVFDQDDVHNSLAKRSVSCLKDMDNVRLVIPLLNEQQLLGFILLQQAVASYERKLSWEDLDLLKTVGRQIASYLAKHIASERLAQSRQFDTYNQLTAFIIHDLKNLIAQQQLVVKNANKHKDNPAFVDDAIKTIENSVTRMSNLLEKIQQKERTVVRRINLKDVLKETARKCAANKPTPSLRTLGGDLYVQADKDQLIMVLAHIVKNAQEATEDNGFVDINLSRLDGYAVLEVEDNGAGMDEEFINERLFKPFETTKTGKGMGIGVYQTREFIRNLGGDVTVRSESGVGTVFTVTIPTIATE
jgi:putative PEP-CTERM system histidine kinase